MLLLLFMLELFMLEFMLIAGRQIDRNDDPRFLAGDSSCLSRAVFEPVTQSVISLHSLLACTM